MLVLLVLLFIFTSPVSYFYRKLALSKNKNENGWTAIFSILFAFVFVAAYWAMLFFAKTSGIAALIISLSISYGCFVVLYFQLEKKWLPSEKRMKETNDTILDDLN